MSTVTISAQQVNELRKITGAGIMDCKKALVEANGDIEQAIDNLRKKGAKVAASRADREAKEGIALSLISADKKRGVSFVLNCETEPVSKNADFNTLATTIADLALNANVTTVEEVKALKIGTQTVEEAIIEKIGVIGEKIEISGYGIVNAEFIGAYNHSGVKSAIVGFNQVIDAEIAKDIAMHIVACNPIALDKDNVDASMLERELEIGREQARAEGKPEEMIEKIAQGKLNKFYKDNTLYNQEYMNDDKKTVKQFVESLNKDLAVVGFNNCGLAR